MSSPKWYIVNTLVGYENKSAKLIREEAEKKGINDLIEELVIPVEVVNEIRRGKKVTYEKNIFPGYLLIKMSLNDITWNLVKSTQYVAKFLGGANKPVEVSEKEVQAILNKVAEVSRHVEVKEVYEVGEMVKIIDGAFESFSAIIEEVDNDKKKLRVSVSIFSRETPLELSFEQVERINTE